MPIKLPHRVRLIGGLSLLALLAGCGGGTSGPASSTATSTPTSTPSTTAASSSSASVSGADLIAGNASAADLYPHLATDLAAVTSVHVMTRGGGQGRPITRDYDLDQAGDCSGREVDGGTRLRFVRYGDTALVTTTQGKLGRSLRGRWLVVDPTAYLPFCVAGTNLLPGDAPTAATLLLGGSGLGPARVDGRDTLHFRSVDQDSAGTRDVWVGASAAGLLQVVRFGFDDGAVRAVSDYTDFGSAKVATLPPPGRRVTPDQLSST